MFSIQTKGLTKTQRELLALIFAAKSATSEQIKAWGFNKTTVFSLQRRWLIAYTMQHIYVVDGRDEVQDTARRALREFQARIDADNARNYHLMDDLHPFAWVMEILVFDPLTEDEINERDEYFANVGMWVDDNGEVHDIEQPSERAQVVEDAVDEDAEREAFDSWRDNPDVPIPFVITPLGEEVARQQEHDARHCKQQPIPLILTNKGLAAIYPYFSLRHQKGRL